MKQNIYDNPEFYAAYSAMRRKGEGLNEVLEQPALYSLLPEAVLGDVLDLGCGDGGQCVKMLALGARSVTGVDISEHMIRAARERCGGLDRITLTCTAIEDFESPEGAFDMIISSLAFHYVADLGRLFRNIHTWLRDSGILVFSIEHPVATCAQGIHPGWHRGRQGEKHHWQVDCYSDEGARRSRWFVDGVLKYHRTVSTIVNALGDSGLCVQRMLEPHAIETAEQERPALLEERRRPPFLLIRAAKARETRTEAGSRERA